MAERNRVTPTGEIVATPLRGAWMGNRGCLHRGHEIVRPWRSRAWITCRLEHKGWSMPQWAPGRYTVLFFHDEAVALAAGHRPCALCRRADYDTFTGAFAAVGEVEQRAPAVDARLHAERLDGRRQRTHRRPWRGLPDGTFVRLDAGPALVVGDRVHLWSADTGYGPAQPRPGRAEAVVLTPPSAVAVLAAGYPVQLNGAVAG